MAAVFFSSLASEEEQDDDEDEDDEDEEEDESDEEKDEEDGGNGVGSERCSPWGPTHDVEGRGVSVWGCPSLSPVDGSRN